MSNKLISLHTFCVENYNAAGRSDENQIDKWFSSEMNRIKKESEDAMELTLFRTAIQKVYFDMQRILKQYIKRCDGSVNSELIKEFIETQLILLTPFTPHICEEIWSEIGKKGFISESSWLKYDESKIDGNLTLMSDYIEQVSSDIRKVKELSKLKKLSKIKIFIADKWKYKFFNIVDSEIEKGNRDFKVILGKIMANDDLRKEGKIITKLLPALLKKGVTKINPNQEIEIINEMNDSLKKEFNAEIDVILAEDSSELKAKQATPGKPSLIVE
jgi:leucyl-tRNA synthetase